MFVSNVFVEVSPGAATLGGYVMSLAVLPRWRSKGIAKALMLQALEDSDDCGDNQVVTRWWRGGEGIKQIWKNTVSQF